MPATPAARIATRVKAARIALGTALVLAALYGVGRLLVTDLAGGGRRAEPAGVRFAAPAGYELIEAGELARPAAARRLAELVTARPAAPRLGLHFTSGGYELYWLVERGAPGERLLELAAGPTGTRIETTYSGDLDARLAWAVQQGRFDAPGAAASSSRNLYH